MLKSVFYDDDVPNFRSLALSQNLYEPIETEFDYEMVGDILLREGDPILVDEDYLDAVTNGDDWDDEVEEREFDGDDDYFAVVWSELDCKKVMIETACVDYNQIKIASPVHYLCFPWLGRGNYYKETRMGTDFYISEFPGEDHYVSVNYLDVVDVKIRQFIDVAEGFEEGKDELNLKDIEGSKTGMYIPHSITDREQAIDVLKSYNIFIPELILKRGLKDLKPLKRKR
jgi:hypothetical protein